MPFGTVKANARARFGDVRVHLEFIEALEPRAPAEEASIQVKLLRGLFYVSLYSALESTVNECVQTALQVIGSQGVENRHYSYEFNVVSLHAKLKGLKAAGHRNLFSKSIDVFSSLTSAEVIQIDDTIFSTSLQNVWFKSLNEVYQCFGLKEFSIEKRLRVSVDEVVDKRNAVAHGRDSSIQIGERHRSAILRSRTLDIQLVADLFVSGIESHVIGLEHIKPSYRADYDPCQTK